MPVDCRMAAGKLAMMLDESRRQALEFDPAPRRVSLPDDSVWRPIDGERLRAIGPSFVELNRHDYITDGGYIVRKGGVPGQELLSKTTVMMIVGWINASKDVMRLKPFLRGMTKEEAMNFVEVMEQRSITPGENGVLLPTGSAHVVPVNPKVERAVTEARSYFRDVERDSSARGLLVGREEFYWPHLRDTQLLTNEQYRAKGIESIAWNRAVRRTAKEMGEAVHRVPRDRVVVKPEDTKFANDKFESYVVPQLSRIAPNIEEQRTLDIPGYDIDPLRVIRRYAQTVRTRLAEHDMFGERRTQHGKAVGLEKLLVELKETMGSPKDQAQLDLFINSAFGYTPYDSTLDNAFARGLSSIQPLKLTYSALSNAQQSINTLQRSNFKTLIKGVNDIMFDREIVEGIGARDFALTAGLVIDNVLRDAALYQGGKIGETLLRYNGFTPVEKFNRMLAAVMGAVYLRDNYALAERGSSRGLKRLSEMGFSLDELRSRGGPDFDDLLIAGRRFVNETQFVDVPGQRIRLGTTMFQSGWGRAALQFKSFTIKQTAMMMREIQRRPGRALMFGFGVMPAVGGVKQFAQNFISEQLLGAPPSAYQERQSEFDEYLESMAAAGSLGILSDLLYSFAVQAETGQLSRSVVIPPMVSTLIDGLSAAGEVYAGRFENAERIFLRQFGGLGSAFARAHLPSEN